MVAICSLPLLIWKNLLLQIRKPLESIFAIFIIIFVCLLLCQIYALHDRSKYTTATYDAVIITQPKLEERSLFWSPCRNKFLIHLVARVAKHLQMYERCYEHSSHLETSLRQPHRLNNRSIIALQFQDELAGKRNISKDFEIVMRFPSDWRTNQMFLPIGTDVKKGEYIVEPMYWVFLRLQNFLFREVVKMLLYEEESGFKYNWTKKRKEYVFDNNRYNKELPDVWLCEFPRPAGVSSDHFIMAGDTICVLLVAAFMNLFYTILRNVGVEKETQIKEIMKIMGVNNWLHWIAWYCTALLFAALEVVMIVVFLSVPIFRKDSVFVLVRPGILLAYFMLYAPSCITFAFAVTVFFKKSYVSLIVGTILFIITMIPYFYTTSFFGKLAGCFLTNSAVMYGLEVMMKYEIFEKHLTWSNIFEPVTPDEHLTVGLVMIMFIVDAVLYMLIALYIEAVFPGNYGLRREWYFPFTSKFWITKPSAGLQHHYKTFIHEENFYEPEPEGFDIGIQVLHLKKKYSKDHIVLRNISFNMFENEITVLVGQNGTGKTTLMSILSGILSPTFGTAIVGGYDIKTDMEKIRESLGFCPQNNVLFNLLTVKEHLYFFCKIRGLTGENLKEEIEMYLKLLDLTDQANTKVKALSEGIKRKLSIGIAMCGNSRVCIMDEPTLGLDPKSRRQVWAAIRAHKIGRTILLSTHFMKEADVLGDRIAILGNGMVQCYGSSFFLKKTYSSGYRLTLVKDTHCNIEAITRLLKNYIPGVLVENDVDNELTYILPESETKVFEWMLGDLEACKEAVGIQSYGLSLSTLEEVFMRVGVEYDPGQEDHQSAAAPNIFSSFHDEYLTGFGLYINQILAMMLKKGLLTVRGWRPLVLHILLPIISTLCCLYTTERKLIHEPKLNFTLDLYSSPVTVMTSTEEENKYYKAYKEILDINKQDIRDWGNTDMNSRMLVQTRENREFARRHLIIGASFFNNSTIVAWYNAEAFHSRSLSLQYIYSAIVKDMFSGNFSIKFSNYPRPKLESENAMEVTSAKLTIIAAGIMFVLPYYGLACAREKLSQARDIQLISGMAVSVFWFVTFLWDFVSFMFILFCVLIVMVCFHADFNYGALIVLYILFIFAVLPFVYLITALFKRPSSVYSTIIILCIFGLLSYFATDTVLEKYESFNYYPFCILFHGIYKITELYLLKKYCRYPASQLGCLETDYYSVKKGIGKHLLHLATAGTTLFIILFIVEYKIYDFIIYRIYSLIRKRPKVEETEDADVLEEKTKVRSGIIDSSTHDVVLKDATKYFKKYLAVNQLCLGVKKYDCFGLLGANGAGKTTTFKMLIGDLKISFGDAWICRWNLKSNVEESHTCIGYCPQFDSLLGNLTCKETLTIYCLIRGIPILHCNAVITALAKALKFENHIYKRIKCLSGGNKRKIHIAIALIGEPPVIFLDEPSSGMDPSAKVFLWNTLCKIRDRGSCILLTTHNMDECEAICTRAGIMVNGAFQCLGSPQYLKNKFADGFVLIVKVRKGINERHSESNIDEVKLFIHRNFCSAELRETHENLLNYLVKSDNIAWATVFSIMERAKKLVAIEDYTLSQFDLEQIFLLFTRMQRDNVPY